MRETTKKRISRQKEEAKTIVKENHLEPISDLNIEKRLKILKKDLVRMENWYDGYLNFTHNPLLNEGQVVGYICDELKRIISNYEFDIIQHNMVLIGDEVY